VTSATPIDVTVGVTKTGVDFALSPGGRVSGTLTDAATGLPLANVTVRIQTPSGSSLAFGRTNGAGVYTTTTGLPPGTYYARTSNALGYVEKLYRDIACPGGSCAVAGGTPISLSAGTTTTGIDFALSKGGRVSGTVTDAVTGLKLAGVTVRVYTSSGSQVTSGYTDGAGVYTTSSGLPAGAYYAVTGNSRGYIDELYPDVVCPGYACALSSGTLITVSLGSTTGGVDFTLAPGGRIRGTLADSSTHALLASVTVAIMNASGNHVTYGYSDASSSGVYTTVGGLPSGTYYARTLNSLGYLDELYDGVSCPGGSCGVTGGAPIAVTAGETTLGIDFTLGSGGRIDGRVTDVAGGAPVC